MTQRASIAYEERMRVPWRWWVAILTLAVVLAAPLVWGAPDPLLRVGFAMLVPAAVAGLWWLGRVRLAVIDDTLVVDDARLPARFVAEAIPLDPAGRQQLLGVSADPLAFVVQRPWIPGAVQIVLDDPADPTPYWLVSSRDPERLAAALTAAR